MIGTIFIGFCGRLTGGILAANEQMGEETTGIIAAPVAPDRLFYHLFFNVT